jgi:hypothetical protein
VKCLAESRHLLFVQQVKPSIVLRKNDKRNVGGDTHSYGPSSGLGHDAQSSTDLLPFNGCDARLWPLPSHLVTHALPSNRHDISGMAMMLLLNPANKYTPTLLFCGGSDVPEAYYGNYSWPYYNTWTYLASMDCQRLMPDETTNYSLRVLEFK